MPDIARSDEWDDETVRAWMDEVARVRQNRRMLQARKDANREEGARIARELKHLDAEYERVLNGDFGDGPLFRGGRPPRGGPAFPSPLEGLDGPETPGEGGPVPPPEAPTGPAWKVYRRGQAKAIGEVRGGSAAEAAEAAGRAFPDLPPEELSVLAEGRKPKRQGRTKKAKEGGAG